MIKTLDNSRSKLDEESHAQQKGYEVFSGSAQYCSRNPYNLTICHQRKFLWYRVAKVGSTTLLHHLEKAGPRPDVAEAFFLRYPVNAYSDYFKFAFVRNPWDRLVSCWRDKVIQNNYFKFPSERRELMYNFPAFVDHVIETGVYRRDQHLMPQSHLIDLNEVTFVGRFEHFEDSLAHVLRKIGVVGNPGVRANNSADEAAGTPHYREYYDERTVRRVALLYQKDIQIFGYSF